MSPLSLGNGEFAFTADITGLQTFPRPRWLDRKGATAHRRSVRCSSGSNRIRSFTQSFVTRRGKRTSRYVLGPPVIPAQENHPPAETWNPTFELSYWSYALKTAQRWRERLGLRINAEWDRVIRNLSPLPAKNGVYLAHENCPETLRETMRRWQWDRRGVGTIQ